MQYLKIYFLNCKNFSRNEKEYLKNILKTQENLCIKICFNKSFKNVFCISSNSMCAFESVGVGMLRVYRLNKVDIICRHEALLFVVPCFAGLAIAHDFV